MPHLQSVLQDHQVSLHLFPHPLLLVLVIRLIQEETMFLYQLILMIWKICIQQEMLLRLLLMMKIGFHKLEQINI